MTKRTNAQDPGNIIDRMRNQLAPHGYIVSVWHIADVQDVRPDLTDKQAMAVLQQCMKYHDAETGINWEVLKVGVSILYPEPETTQGEK